jgi:hypothetical protein
VNADSEPRAIFAEYVSGVISKDQLLKLDAALRNDEELRRDFTEYLNLDSAISNLAALSEADFTRSTFVTNSSVGDDVSTANHLHLTSESNFRSHGSRRAFLIAGTVAASLILAAITWWASVGLNHDPQVATIVAEVDSTLTKNGEVWGESRLPVGMYQLKRGLLHLQFAGGVMVYVEAPARFDTESETRLVLHSGRLSASVPPEGIGFTVETPEAEVIDFGTEFSIDVEVGQSEVHVFDGLVRVHSRNDSGSNIAEAVDLRTSQAVRIDSSSSKPVEIKLATDRFIRNFDEPKRKYGRSVKQLSPVAYYRMPIRDKGLVSEPPQYSGEVLTGDGKRPPHAKGVFSGGSLRVKADSTGRGGRVDTPPPLSSGNFSLAVFVYLETRSHDSTVAFNLRGDDGNFGLSLDRDGLLLATVRSIDGKLRSVTSDTLLPLKTWCHLVMTANGKQLRLFQNGKLMTITDCAMLASCASETVWFGTEASGTGLWDGRIDELALFDRALSDKDVAELHQAALEEMARTQ